MKTRIILLTTVAVSMLLLSGMSYAAGILYTAPANASYPTDQTIYCDIINVYPAAAAPKNVTIDIMDYDATVVSTSGPISLSSGHGTALGSTGTGAYCRFTVAGDKAKYRATAVYDNGSVYSVAVPAK
jgi:hypothetical protein